MLTMFKITLVYFRGGSCELLVKMKFGIVLFPLSVLF